LNKENALMSADFLSPIEDVIEDARNGRMFILVDAEDRENEGDLVIPAQMATPDAVNFMARYGRGLICLTLTQERADVIGLRPMSSNNQMRNETAFTISIEALEGVSTGISAHDRSHTISVAIDPTMDKKDIVSPGHVFPLVAREGGVLVRTGHTEAAVDIARLAGLYPAGVICEIMNDDGTMARMPDLIPFAQLHGLKVGTIADLIAYRRKYDNLIHRAVDTTFQSDIGGEWRMLLYINKVEYAEHIVLVKGNVSSGEAPLVRMHAVNVFDDLLAMKGGRSDQLMQSMQMIADEERGVVVLIRETQETLLSDMLVRKGVDIDPPKQLKEYGVGAQILRDLGVTELINLTNAEKKVVGLEGYGLTIRENRPIPHHLEKGPRK
jgi:3,4-dihydroxy 2-butanone 4-phosphate synthase / GTP cyclohydrolase II